MFYEGSFYRLTCIDYKREDLAILTLINNTSRSLQVDCKEVMPVLRRFNPGQLDQWTSEEADQLFKALKRTGDDKNEALRFCDTDEGILFNSHSVAAVTAVGYDLFGLIDNRMAFDVNIARKLYDNFLTDV